MLITSTAIPALSGTGGQVAPHKDGVTWQEFLNQHSDIYVEYKYSAHKPLARLAASGQKVKLPAGTPVVIKITETVKSSDATEGSSIAFTVVQDVSLPGIG